jgi:hypothetical protein
MSARDILVYALWVLPQVFQATLLVIMVRRRLRAEFSLFFAFLVFELASFVVLFYVYHWAFGQYFYAYWVSNTLEAALGFAAIYEAFRVSLKRYGALHELAAVLFRWVLALMVLIGVVIALSAEGSEASRLVAGVLSFDRSARLMQCGLVLFLVLFARHLGLSLRSHGFSIAVGFGIAAATELTAMTMRVYFGWTSAIMVSLMVAAGYNIAVLLWFYALRLPEPAPAVAVAQWNTALSTAGGDAESDAFLPYLERTVEKVLARRRTS